MHKFIISDIHGNGDLYNSVMGYLENISKYDDVILYINGDLIDRGSESGKILLDLITRMNNPDNPFKIVYLAGNHELMMHKVFERRRKQKIVSEHNDWYRNGGRVTDDALVNLLGDKEAILKVADFISNLQFYHKFDELLNGKKIVLVHAACPLKVNDECTLTIKNSSLFDEYYVWVREDDGMYPFKCRIGHKDYFTIIGHTPNNKRYGYFYNSRENYLNIDGGCAAYAYGHYEYDHYPLVEIKDDYLSILTFNSNNEIIYGNYFKDGKSIPFTNEEMTKAREYLNEEVAVKKYIRLPDDLIGCK